MDPFLGEIRMFGFGFPPKGWLLCQGQTLSINQNAALYSLLGTLYGGNGVSTFVLPNLVGLIAVNAGQGAGLSLYGIGQTGGSSTVTLDSQHLPVHSHTLPAAPSPANRLSAPSPSNYLGALPRGATPVYSTPQDQSANKTNMLQSSIGPSGGGQAHNNMGSYLVVNYAIATVGIYPLRP